LLALLVASVGSYNAARLTQSHHYHPARTLAALNLKGVLLPFTTPFNSDQSLDLEGLRSNLRRWNETGIAGYVALGSTGERVNLDEREYMEVIETARAEVPRELSFIVGAGHQSTLHTINEIKRAASAGADGVLVLTPSFYKAAIHHQSLVDHYVAVADASAVPVILYSMPDLTGVAIEPKTVAELSAHPNILGLKDSSNDIARFDETLNSVPEEFAMLTGNGTVFLDALHAGAEGAILAVGCVAAECCLRIFETFQAGDVETARAFQEKLAPLALAVTKRYGIGGLKAAMEMRDFAGGNVRAPLKSPSAEAKNEIAALLHAVLNLTGRSSESSSDPVGFAGALP
jgi:4-hydroxy-2-oxoglutarate aldolase